MNDDNKLNFRRNLPWGKLCSIVFAIVGVFVVFGINVGWDRVLPIILFMMCFGVGAILLMLGASQKSSRMRWWGITCLIVGYAIGASQLSENVQFISNAFGLG
ncbi:hypothetical protein SAMN04488118_11716 [Epibacterium ulvae]|uniref:Uncharacterized protein n=1 Tax=Epibacterium ulvae TaxID=1156985 RepID=A0A1G5RHA8_9RHOB|nr:hypothetical protein [Epibacterium ulvae]SCZ73396.1 hypothetical protein SAMN04488118_11716 [Epibacterium ulvae]